MPAGRPRVDVSRQLERNRMSRNKKAAASPEPVRLGGGPVRMPSDVKADPVARAKWNELKKLFAGKEYVGASDAGVVVRYCFLCSEEAALRGKLKELLDGGGELKDTLAVNKAIDAKRSLIRSLEDRLYLNPLAKMRGLPPEAKPIVATPLERAGFGEV